MLRSLYSGVSGMRSFQTKMDVVANNIANVNTTGFKSGRAKFQDMLSQTQSNAQGPQGSLGGVNPQQVGLGVRVGSIDTIMTDGPLQPTGRNLDFAIEGSGFFIVSADGGKNHQYTRDGAFYTDYQGNLVNSSGMKVMGVMPVKNIPTSGGLDALKIEPTKNGAKLEDFTIDSSGKIYTRYAGEASATHVGTVAMATFINPEGLTKDGNNLYSQSNNSGTVEQGAPGSAGTGFIRQSFLEMSNVDLANEFTEMIVTSRAYQANSRSITTSDEMLQELINLKR